MPRIESGSAHVVAADAGELRVGETRAQRVDQPGAELVARGLARDQADPAAGRAMRQRSKRPLAAAR